MNYWNNFAQFMILFFLQAQSTIIKTPSVPLCKNCIHFKPYDYLDNKEDDYKYGLGKCMFFYTINENTGKPFFSHAFLCRNDESLCGYNGNQYTEKYKL